MTDSKLLSLGIANCSPKHVISYHNNEEAEFFCEAANDKAATLIVQCVNSHDSLKEVLEETKSSILAWAANTEFYGNRAAYKRILARIEAVLEESTHG